VSFEGVLDQKVLLIFVVLGENL